MFATYHEALKDGVFWKASCQHLRWGVGRAQWLEHWTCDWKVTGSNPCRSDGRILCSRVNFLCWLLFWYLYHPHVTAVAHKRSRSFWQLTAKQACTFVCVTLREVTWCIVVWCTQNEMAAVSCGTSHASSISTSLDFQKHAIKSYSLM